jgi:hypothetical protein
MADMAATFGRGYSGRVYNPGRALPAESISSWLGELSSGIAPSTLQQYINTTYRYVLMMRLYDLDPFRLSFRNLSLYAVHTVQTREIAGSTIRCQVSHVRKIGQLLRWPDDCPEGSRDGDLMGNLCSKLVKMYPSTSPERLPVRLTHLMRIRKAMDEAIAASPTGAAQIDFEWLVLTTSHQALLRVGDLLNLKVGDVTPFSVV